MKKFNLVAFMLLFYYFGNAQNKNFIDQPYIEVSGYADTLVTPNEIFIRILLSEKDTRDREPIEELEQKLTDALKGLGLDPEKDLTASDMASGFKHYLLKGKDIIKSKTYLLKVTKAVTASRVFIKLEEIGISNTTIERVDHSDMKNIKNTMRSNAIIDAKTRAETLTKPLSQTVGFAIHITDGENISQQLYGLATAKSKLYEVSSFNADAIELPNIEFEKIKVIANINAKFILK